MIILIGGKAGEGKSTLANFCIEYSKSLNLEVTLIPFPSNVKKIGKLLGWDGNKDNKGRRLLQDVGRIGREYNPNIWADKIVDEIVSLFPINYAFVDDWRFLNESNVMQQHFSPVIKVRIRRPEEFHTLIGTSLYNDISETSLPEDDKYYDFVINNNLSLGHLEREAENLINKIQTIFQNGRHMQWKDN